MNDWLSVFGRQLLGAFRDLTPIIAVVVVFQLFVLREPIPELADILGGAVLVVLGLALFVQGLEQSLFPLGESLAYAFARKGSLTWLMLFAFGLGFGASVAEPALLAVSSEAAATVAEAGLIETSDAALASYALGLRLTVALSVGIAIVIGVLRILRGWPLQYLIIAGYGGVVLMTLFAPAPIIGIAYDVGGVTTSTVTVPLVTALGIGLASSIRGRNPMLDGFGMIALAALTPMMFVMAYGLVLE